MGSIYGNRNRNNNHNVNNGGCNVKDNKPTQNTRNRGKAAFKNNRSSVETKPKNLLENIRFRRFIFSVIVSLIITTIFIILTYVLIDGDYRSTYTKMLFLPISSFCMCFLLRFLSKDILMNFAGSMVVLLVAFLIFVDFSWSVLLWLLFYLVNGILGMIIAAVSKQRAKQ